MIVNFVMSSYVDSSIFNHLIEYYKKSGLKAVKTLKPIKNADVYYYFRPHLEDSLKWPAVVTVHHDLEDTDENLRIESFIERYKEADLVICLNTKQQDILKEHGINNTKVIPHGYNPEVLNNIIDSKRFDSIQSSKKKTIGFFSHSYARGVKGEEYFLSLASRLSNQDYRFILVGKKRNELGDTLRSKGFECYVFESLPYKYFGKLYSLIDALLITSKFEGGPASLPEALATETRVFTTQVGMAHDLKDHGLVNFLTKDLEIDVEMIESCIKSPVISEKSSNPLSWSEVSFQYFNELKKVSRSKNSCLCMSSYIDIVHFKFKTLYPRRKIRSFKKWLAA